MRYLLFCGILWITPTLIFGQVKTVSLPDHAPVKLTPYAQLDTTVNVETSGIIKSRLYDGIYWIHNDSGDDPRIIPINRQGEIVQSYRYKTNQGQFIGDAVNMDWEDILTDDQGNIIVADFGNNCNCRRDLVFYYIRESDPIQRNNRVFKKVFFQYPDQQIFPATEDDFNYDAEGAFYANGKIYVLTKNRSDTYTKLYRLDETQSETMNTLTPLGAFDIQGRVTGADASEDGKTLAVLTYSGIWLFEVEKGDEYFDGNIRWLPIEASGTEGICLDGDRLIISQEPGGYLYELAVDQLISVQ
ncbi:MAG: hypothetical protein AAF632_15945 [Bacteroidota bacterium]